MAVPSRARLYPGLIGPAWQGLDEELRHFFGAFGSWRGRFDIRRGTGLPGRLVGALIRLPRQGIGVPTLLEVTCDGSGERWLRSFGNHRLVTRQRRAPRGLLAERMPGLEILLRISIAGREIRFEQVAAALALGPLRLPLPRWLAPQVTARTWLGAAGDSIGVRVNMTGPGASLWMEYEGSIECRPPAP